MSVATLVNRVLSVHRPDLSPDGSGGQDVVLVDVGDVDAMVSQPSADERREAAQWGAEHTHTIHCLPGADVRRGDELRGDGQAFRAVATMADSRNTYLRVAAELVQAAGTSTALLYPGPDVFPAADLYPMGA